MLWLSLLFSSRIRPIISFIGLIFFFNIMCNSPRAMNIEESTYIMKERLQTLWTVACLSADEDMKGGPPWTMFPSYQTMQGNPCDHRLHFSKKVHFYQQLAHVQISKLHLQPYFSLVKLTNLFISLCRFTEHVSACTPEIIQKKRDTEV
jgi:hypothetical protein